MSEKLNVAWRTSNSVGFIAKKGSLWLNTDSLEYETYDAGNYADYIILGTRVGDTPVVEADFPTGAPAGKADILPVEAVGSNGAGLGGFSSTYDQPAGGLFEIQWNGSQITDLVGDDVDPLVALVTLTEAKQYLDITDSESDAIVAALINSCSEWVVGHIGRKLLSETLTEYYHGDGSSLLMLNRRPVVSITSIHVDGNRLWDSTSEVASSDYQLDKQAGMIRAWNLFGNWVCGTSNIRVIYVAGYTAGPTGTMPKDLKLAVLRMIDHQWRDGFQLRKLDKISDVVGDINTSYRDGDVPKDAQSILARYQNYLGSPQFDYAD
jgi:uncharacterized phiE125 gp8 family phage protein